MATTRWPANSGHSWLTGDRDFDQIGALRRRKRFFPGLVAFAAMLQLTPSLVVGEERSEEERALIFEIGATGEREVSEGSTHFGPAVGLEIEPIENWLEVEIGASRFSNGGATAWDLDLPFKKPWRLSETIEVMPGLGPTWAHTNRTGERANTWGAEAVVDLFFWRTRRIGWFVEPAYGVAFAAGHAKSLTITAGFFVAIP
jgi:hypothetical protein